MLVLTYLIPKQLIKYNSRKCKVLKFKMLIVNLIQTRYSFVVLDSKRKFVHLVIITRTIEEECSVDGDNYHVLLVGNFHQFLKSTLFEIPAIDECAYISIRLYRLFEDILKVSQIKKEEQYTYFSWSSLASETEYRSLPSMLFFRETQKLT